MSDPRKLPFTTRLWPKLVMAAIVACPLMWIMNAHYDYSKEHHYKDEENPISYGVYALQHAANDATGAYNKTMKLSDQIVAGAKGEPPPGTVEPTRTLPPRYIPQRPAPPPQTYQPSSAPRVTVCVPNNLISMWENTAAYPKMSAYKELMAAFIEANGRPGKEYFIGNFDIYEPGVTDPSVLVSEGDAQQGCPVGFTPYTLPVYPR